MVERLYDGARRDFVGQAREEPFGCLTRPFDLDEHAGRVVDDPAVEAEFGRQPVDKRPESHPLHRTVDFNTEPGECHV